MKHLFLKAVSRSKSNSETEQKLMASCFAKRKRKVSALTDYSRCYCRELQFPSRYMLSKRRQHGLVLWCPQWNWMKQRLGTQLLWWSNSLMKGELQISALQCLARLRSLADGILCDGDCCTACHPCLTCLSSSNWLEAEVC